MHFASSTQSSPRQISPRTRITVRWRLRGPLMRSLEIAFRLCRARSGSVCHLVTVRRPAVSISEIELRTKTSRARLRIVTFIRAHSLGYRRACEQPASVTRCTVFKNRLGCKWTTHLGRERSKRDRRVQTKFAQAWGGQENCNI